MEPTIFLALTHDWELRGDGSGDIHRIQFEPLRRLLDIYAQHARTTFLPDVMQQLAFRRLESKHPELKSLADLWDEHVREAIRQGHDIQLHLHPQWNDAQFEPGRWRVNGDWSIDKYDRQIAYRMLTDCKSYLESLLRPIDGDYRCLAFRAGALAAAPSEHLFDALVKMGIRIDVSIAPGLLVDNQQLKLDYRKCEEDFLPYYPSLKDARRVSQNREPIVCVPLNHFHGSRRAVARQNISLVGARIRSESRPPSTGATPSAASEHSRSALVFEKLIKPVLQRKYLVSDTGRLDYRLMREMLSSIRRRGKWSGLSQLPVVLTNHPKDIRDWGGLKRFVGELAEANDVKFVTLRDLARMFDKGEFYIRQSQNSDGSG